MNENHSIEAEKLPSSGTKARLDADPPTPDVGDLVKEDEATESDQEQQARESEKAFDVALTRLPPG